MKAAVRRYSRPRIQIPLSEQLRRTQELDEIRMTRPLTEAEHAEADALAHRAYMREWKARQFEVERRLADIAR